MLNLRDIFFILVLLVVLVTANILIFSINSNKPIPQSKYPESKLFKNHKINLSNNDKDLKIVVKKGERKLLLYSGDKLLRDYKIDLGLNPKDDTEVEGDGCTPVGIFYICTKNPKSKFYLSLGISYPNEEDAKRGIND